MLFLILSCYEYFAFYAGTIGFLVDRSLVSRWVRLLDPASAERRTRTQLIGDWSCMLILHLQLIRFRTNFLYLVVFGVS